MRKNPLPQGILFKSTDFNWCVDGASKVWSEHPTGSESCRIWYVPDYIYQDLKLVQMRISDTEGVLLAMDLLDKKIRQYSMSKVKIYTEAEMIIS